MHPCPSWPGEDMPAGPADPIFNRLLKDRIIWMGEEVKDEMANRHLRTDADAGS